jgi:hypothetical protein
MFPSSDEQSTSCCSERVVMEDALALMTSLGSIEPTVEKAQQDPHCPWFLTAAMYLPAGEVQSTVVGSDSFPKRGSISPKGDLAFFSRSPVYLATNSS